MYGKNREEGMAPSQWLIFPTAWKEWTVNEMLAETRGSRVSMSEGTRSIPAEQ